MDPLLDRVRQFHPPPRAGRSRYPCRRSAVGRVGVPSALTHILRDLKPKASCALSVSPISTISCGTRPTKTSGSVDGLPNHLQLADLRPEREDVAARARLERRSVESAARTARRVLPERARALPAAHAVAPGPHARRPGRDVPAAAPRGVPACGVWRQMHPRNGVLIRPLLSVPDGTSCAPISPKLGSRRLLEDESNADVSIPRNRGPVPN